eukprot:3832460-Prymnesium_polylepis.2
MIEIETMKQTSDASAKGKVRVSAGVALFKSSAFKYTMISKARPVIQIARCMTTSITLAWKFIELGTDISLPSLASAETK